MATIPQNSELLKNLSTLLAAHRTMFKQERTYRQVVALVLAELFALGRHTVTQLLLTLGLADQDWSRWYRLFSQKRFDAERASAILFGETLQEMRDESLYVVAGDATQTPRSSRKLEGAWWLRNLRTPPFMMGIHAAQRWFHGCWLVPAEAGYSRAIPLRWLPAFTEKSKPEAHAPLKEWEAAVVFLKWVRDQLAHHGEASKQVLMVADGSYDTRPLWQHLPAGVILFARSAKNRALYHLPEPQTGRGRRRKYGSRAETPQQVWQARTGWRKLTLHVRGRDRHLQVKVRGPFVRKGAAEQVLMLVVVRGKKNKRTTRIPLPFLVNAAQDDDGQWHLPLPVETLLFWAWQRWEIEVAHRELKTTFGLGHKQCFNPTAAVVSVQWSAWVYAVMLLAGYRTWGLTGGPPVPTRWWRGSGRWSLDTLWRSYRAAFWAAHHFSPLSAVLAGNWLEKDALSDAWRHAIFGASPS